MRVKLKKLHPDAIVPTIATPGSAWADLYSVDAVTIEPGDRALVRTGWAMSVEPGSYVQIVPRSGLALKHGITVLNSPGTIDSDYTGPVGVILVNHGHAPYFVNPGDRVAQMIVQHFTAVTGFHEVDDLDQTERGAGGFGSTGAA